MSRYHKIVATMTEEVDVDDLFSRSIDQFPGLSDDSGGPPGEPPDDGGDDGDGDSPWERGRERERAILDGIRELAERFDVGPLAPMRIDALGNITMLQRMVNDYTYESDEGLSDELRKLMRRYDPDYRGEISGRWVRLNHFVWERALSELGML